MSDPNPNPGLTLMSDPNANPDYIFLIIISPLQNQCSCFDCLVFTTVAQLLAYRYIGMHFSSIVQKLCIPIVSHDRILLECSVYAGCIILHISMVVSFNHAP